MLFLHELKQVLVLVEKLSFINETFLSSRYYPQSHMLQHFLIQLFANGGIYSKHLNSANKVVCLARYAIQDLCNTDTYDMNNTQSRFLSSLNL